MLLIGIDEAGYGPLLGPLVVAGTAFRVEDAGDAAEDRFAERFLECCHAAGGLRVDDSKRVHGDGGTAALERGVLPFVTCAPGVTEERATREARDAVSPFAAFLEAVGCPSSGCRSLPWYAEEPGRFPSRVDAAEVAATTARLSASLAAGGIDCVAVRATVVPEDHLNLRFEASGNKADVLFDLSAGVADALLASARPGEPVVVVFDRQGGRRRYLGKVQTHWPDLWAWTLDESPLSSVYRLDGAPGPRQVRFDVGADGRSPQVALASMTAKLLRETFMDLWNAWFARLCPDVSRTAGYTQDGRRWLDATRSARHAAGIPDERLVRVR